MVVDAMKENDATAEVPGLGTSKESVLAPKYPDRLFSSTARTSHFFHTFKKHWRRPPKINILCKCSKEQQHAALRQCAGQTQRRKTRPVVQPFVKSCLSGRRPQVEKLRSEVCKARKGVLFLSVKKRAQLSMGQSKMVPGRHDQSDACMFDRPIDWLVHLDDSLNRFAGMHV